MDPLEKEKWIKAKNIFIEKVLKKAFDNNIKMDYSLSDNVLVLDLYQGVLSVFLKGFKINLNEYFLSLYYGKLDKIIKNLNIFENVEDLNKFIEKRKQFFKDEFYYPNFF